MKISKARQILIGAAAAHRDAGAHVLANALDELAEILKSSDKREVNDLVALVREYRQIRS
jgi:hypothetical protein